MNSLIYGIIAGLVIIGVLKAVNDSKLETIKFEDLPRRRGPVTFGEKVSNDTLLTVDENLSTIEGTQ